MDKEQLQQELLQAAKGLLMRSEIDAPFEFFYHKEAKEKFTPNVIAKWTGKPAGTTVETLELQDFFRHMTRQPEHLSNNTEAERYQELEKKLSELLPEVRVYLIDQIGTDAYILGKSEQNSYAGLKTMIVKE